MLVIFGVPIDNNLVKILAVMPEDKTKFTILIDRVNATAANQDIEMVKAMSAMYQVSVWHLSAILVLSAKVVL